MWLLLTNSKKNCWHCFGQRKKMKYLIPSIPSLQQLLEKRIFLPDIYYFLLFLWLLNSSVINLLAYCNISFLLWKSAMKKGNTSPVNRPSVQVFASGAGKSSGVRIRGHGIFALHLESLRPTPLGWGSTPHHTRYLSYLSGKTWSRQ